MKSLAVGSFVSHRTMPERGTGKVVCVCDKYVRVIFIDEHDVRHDMRPDRTYVELMNDPENVARFDGLAVQSTSDCKPVLPPGKKTTGKAGSALALPEWTREQAYERFLTHYPGGFQSQQYVEAERAWKVTQGALWHQLFADPDLRSLASSDPLVAGDLVMKVVQTKGSALLATQAELPRLAWALRHGAPAPFLLALADVLDSPTPTAPHFDALVHALESIPTSKAGSRLGSWPVLTIVPFLVKPDAHMFLKPKVTQEVARKLGVDLMYTATPAWQGYQRLLSWSHELLTFLKPHGATDLIDVQSFIWTIGQRPA